MNRSALLALHRASLVRLGVIAVAVLSLVAVAGCGSSSGSASGGSTGGDPGGEEVPAKSVSEAKAAVAEFKQAPTWEGPSQPIEGLGKAKGELIVCLASNFAVPFEKEMCEDGGAAAEEAGFKVLKLDGKGDPSVYNEAIRQAVSQHATGLLLVSIPPEVVMPALKSAQAAGVQVVLTANDPIEYRPPPEIGANVTVDYKKVGELQSDYAIATTEGPVHAYGFWGSGFASEEAQYKGRDEQLMRLCPACSIKEQSVLISNFSETIPPTVQSQIQQNPDLNWFLPTFDALNLYVVPAVIQAGAEGKVRSSSHNGLEENLKYILNEEVQVMSVGEDTEWWAFGGIDALLRLIVGQEVEAESIPIRLFDKEVLEEVGTDKIGDADALYGNAPFKENYLKLWGAQ